MFVRLEHLRNWRTMFAMFAMFALSRGENYLTEFSRKSRPISYQTFACTPSLAVWEEMVTHHHLHGPSRNIVLLRER